MKDSKTFWDNSAQRYAKSRIQDEAAYRKKLEITQRYLQPDWSVLEFGCGTGSTAMVHAPYVKEVLATDISDNMLAIAAQKTKDAGIGNIRFQQGTLESINPPVASFDAVLGLNILHLLEDPDSAISASYKALKPGGVFITSTALVKEMNILWRMLIPVMQVLNLAPFVHRFNKTELVEKLNHAGFSIDHLWQPAAQSVFIVARK
ncbi:class I SAM-dependent methyltransferase [Thalassolituus alkanivorans]|uniref:class I SAM-dependent methyltransferase n=1 Tax=Thalassolituus alkanivorans TaxID=2881055 RepID=UPI001E526F51|nr:class I SAM-dependent methyltransferase [Thalassolituus alkanivorans]MCB2385667.1 class I SAM-dependent methyltransferase [Thalassolituus alkanivorans]MCB2422765.1 class I SAM-dependent methyltransferase [Thalassolituus alkanivorans]